jgi:galactitol-specific phosphotransferase system IIB component
MTFTVADVRKVLIAGGLCGPTMLMAAEKIEEACMARKIRVNIKVHNLWESQYPGEGFDVIIEMFPFFKNEKCPIVNGKPFINHIGDKELVRQIVDWLADGKTGQDVFVGP